MKPYAYLKVDTENSFVQQRLALSRGRKIIAGSLSLVGLSLMTYVGGYYGLWQMRKSAIAEKAGIVDTLALTPQSGYLSQSPIGADRVRSTSEVSASEIENDYFPNFRLSVPKLSISNALVTSDVMSDNKDIYLPILNSSLAHYKGSAYPGESGNVLVYGHSIMPAFYNPKNYLSIFSKLDTLSARDLIRITWGETVYTYRVEGMSVVSPEDMRILTYSNGKTLTLLTCVPPGLTTDRLLVFARLEE